MGGEPMSATNMGRREDGNTQQDPVFATHPHPHCSVCGIAFCIVTTNSVWGETHKYRSRVRLRAEAGVDPRQPIEGKSYALQAR